VLFICKGLALRLLLFVIAKEPLHKPRYTAEWLLGIIAYITFVALIKNNEFSYIKGLLGF